MMLDAKYFAEGRWRGVEWPRVVRATAASLCVRKYRAARLLPQVEGTCSGAFGYIVSVNGVEDTGKGVIREGTGFAQVPAPPCRPVILMLARQCCQRWPSCCLAWA